VEDEIVLLRLFRTVLEAEGYSVLTASSGEEAMELAHAHPGKIRLLLTDIVLEGQMNGFELSSQLCSLEPEMKVIHMTGYSDVTSIEGATIVPDMTMLHKPINADMLRRSVREKLAEKTFHARIPS
jgi:DNA-binding NtrC family response regulator